MSVRRIRMALAEHGVSLGNRPGRAIVAVPTPFPTGSPLMPRPANLAKLSVAELHRELKRRQKGGQSLLRKREKLVAKLAALDTQIAELGIQGGGRRAAVVGGGKRHKNETSLVGALAAALKGKTMGVSEAADAVQRAGYKTTAANFKVMVNGTLLNSGKFKRVERGQYTAK